MELYDTEEEQVEALKKWWKENSTSLIVGLLLGLSIILGWNYWKDHKKARATEASVVYQQLLKAVDGDKKDEAEKLSQRLQQDYKDTSYAGFGGLWYAKLKVQQADYAAAKQILQSMIGSTDKSLSHIARIRLVRLMLATGEYEQGLQLVNEVSASDASSYSASYDELVGDLYVALDRLDEARTAYQSALRNGHRSPLLQLKIDDLTAPEKMVAQK